jgi:hypothetical protein
MDAIKGESYEKVSREPRTERTAEHVGEREPRVPADSEKP